jgi:uncharacterized membrane protein YagU involved in acid resistance
MEAPENSEEHKKGKRIRVRKRIRVKKKTDPKNRVRKVIRIVLWIAIVISFISTLVIMVKEADIRDKDKSFKINPHQIIQQLKTK